LAWISPLVVQEWCIRPGVGADDTHVAQGFDEHDSSGRVLEASVNFDDRSIVEPVRVIHDYIEQGTLTGKVTNPSVGAEGLEPPSFAL
jgi:hypothetical protein